MKWEFCPGAPPSLKQRNCQPLNHVWLFAIPQTVAHQVPLSMGFSRQEYWSGLLFPSPGDLPDPGIEPRSSTLWADSSPSEPPGKSNSQIPKGVSFPTKKLKPAPEDWQSPGGRKCWSSQFWSQVLNSAPFHHTSLNRMRKGTFFCEKPLKCRDCSSHLPSSVSARSLKEETEGNGNPLQYFFLGTPMDRKAWRATNHGITKRGTSQSD